MAKIRKELEKKFKSEFNEIKLWLFYLYEIDCVFSQEDYQSLLKTANLLYSLADEVSVEEQWVDDERMELEESVNNMVTQLNSDINVLLN